MVATIGGPWRIVGVNLDGRISEIRRVYAMEIDSKGIGRLKEGKQKGMNISIP